MPTAGFRPSFASLRLGALRARRVGVQPDLMNTPTRYEDPGLRLEVQEGAERTTILASGEVDIASVDELGEAVRARLVGGPVRLDLSGLSFMDSSGVRLLDALARESAAAGGGLVLASTLQPPVRRILELAGMLGGLPFEDGR